MSKLEQLKEWIQRRSHKFLRLMGVAGVLIGWAVMYFFDKWDGPVFWALICVSAVLSATGAWGGLSEQWGYKPLTNDPLGWRKAKKSYESSGPASQSDESEKR